MAIHAGVVMRDGGPVPERLHLLLRERVLSFAPDEMHEMRGAGYLVVHGARSWAGRQQSWREAPARARHYVACFDGRLDNRQDLLLRYFSHEERRLALSDSAIVGRVLMSDAARCAVGCVGDWSAALVGTTDRTVTLASDAMGARPLYYAITPWGVTWSTDLATVTRAADLRPSDLDPDYFAGFITALPPPFATPFKGVFSVRPGATLTITTDGRQVEHVWWAPWHISLRPDWPEDSALELAALWKQIIDDRIPRTAPALFELSGGFDSSSIVSMAAALKREAGHPALHTVTRVFPNEPGWNDLRFVRAVLAQSDCVPHFLDLSMLPTGRDLTAPVPDGPHGTDLATEMLMHEIGARTLVSGRKGDLVMQAPTLDSSTVTASLHARRFRDVVRESTAVARASRVSAWRVLRDACQPFRTRYAGGLFTLLVDRRRRMAAVRQDLVQPSVLQHVHDRWAEIYRACRHTSPARRALVFDLVRLTYRRQLEPLPNQAHLFHAHPFLDRRLVTFVLEREPRVISGAGQSRELMKKAFQQVLPDAVLTRRSKGNFAPIMRRRFAPTADLLLRTDRWALAELGVIRADVVRSWVKRFVDDPKMVPGGLMPLAFAEFWLRRELFDDPCPNFAIDRATTTEFSARALQRGDALLQEEMTA
jgi:asparagine synthase (glutamine-hydrolysing)